MSILETIRTKIESYYHDNYPPDPTVFVSRKDYHELRSQRRYVGDDDVTIEGHDVREDRYVDAGHPIVLPADIDDLVGDLLFQANPTRHHCEQLIDPTVERNPLDGHQDQYFASQQVFVEALSDTWTFDYDALVDSDVECPTFDRLLETILGADEATDDQFESTMVTHEDVDRLDPGEQAWRITRSYEPATLAQAVPIKQYETTPEQLGAPMSRFEERFTSAIAEELPSSTTESIEGYGDDGLLVIGRRRTELGRLCCRRVPDHSEELRVQ